VAVLGTVAQTLHDDVHSLTRRDVGQTGPENIDAIVARQNIGDPVHVSEAVHLI